MNLNIIELNNYEEIGNKPDTELILKALATSDDHLIKKIDYNITTSYKSKLNLINHLLNNKSLKKSFATIDNIKHFFAMISPLSNYYKLGSFKYNIKIESEYLFIQNSIPKEYISHEFDKFIENIIDHFDNLDFHFYDLKNKRFNKTMDFIFVFKIKDNMLIKKIE